MVRDRNTGKTRAYRGKLKHIHKGTLLGYTSKILISWHCRRNWILSLVTLFNSWLRPRTVLRHSHMNTEPNIQQIHYMNLNPNRSRLVAFLQNLEKNWSSFISFQKFWNIILKRNIGNCNELKIFSISSLAIFHQNIEMHLLAIFR